MHSSWPWREHQVAINCPRMIRKARRVFRWSRSERIACVVLDTNGPVAGLRHATVRDVDLHLPPPAVVVEFDRWILPHHDDAVLIVNVGRDPRILGVEVLVCCSVVA